MVDRVLRPVVQSLLSLLLAVALAVTVLLFGVRGAVYSERLYSRIPDDPAFINGMETYVSEALEAECLFYDLPFETVKQAVTRDRLLELSREYASAVYTSLCSGDELGEFTVDPAPYRAVLDTYFASLPEAERPVDANTSAVLSEELARVTASVLSSGLINRVLDYGHRFVYGDSLLRKVTSYAPWALVLTVLLAALSLIPWGGWRRRLYATSGAAFIGSALAFVPLWLLQQHDLAERLALGASPLKLYVGGIVNGVVNGMTAAALWVFIGCLVGLIASIVILVCQKKKEFLE